jgi:hypothetical protein
LIDFSVSKLLLPQSIYYCWLGFLLKGFLVLVK